MWTYTAPTVQQQHSLRKVQEVYDKAVHRGLKTIKVEEKLSLRQLQARILHENQRIADACRRVATPHEQEVSVIRENGTDYAIVCMGSYPVLRRDVWGELHTHKRQCVVHIPIRNYWHIQCDPTYAGEQFCRWSP